MPFIITPGQLSARAELYHQLGVLLSAGLGLPQALETVQKNPTSRSLYEPLRQLEDSLAKGYTFTQAVDQLGSWIPSFDAALIQAGDTSGRLDQCFKLLATYYDERARMVRQMISDLLYPAFILHFAIVLFPLVQLFQDGNVNAFFFKIIAVIIPLYAIVLGLIFACQGKHGESWRRVIEIIAGRIPLLGSARRKLALARLAAALEALINAGVSIFASWELAAAASGSPALRRAVLAWRWDLQRGATPADLLAGTREFPEMFASMYRTGEVSGTLDDTLRRLHMIYQEDGTHKMRMVSRWFPQIIYGCVAGLVALKVISFYVGYFQQVGEAIKGF